MIFDLLLCAWLAAACALLAWIAFNAESKAELGLLTFFVALAIAWPLTLAALTLAALHDFLKARIT